MAEANDEQTERLVKAFEGIAANIAKHNEIQERYLELMTIRHASVHELELQRAERDRISFEQSQIEAADAKAKMEAMLADMAKRREAREAGAPAAQ